MDLRAWYEEYLAACNERRFDELHRFVHQDVVVNGRTTGLTTYVSDLRAVVASFADYCWTVEHLLVDLPWIAAHLVDTGTHTGLVRGLVATGRAVRTHEFAHYRLVDGRIAEVWVTADDLAVLDQLGGAG